jgi:hypothetical protein
MNTKMSEMDCVAMPGRQKPGRSTRLLTRAVYNEGLTSSKVQDLLKQFIAIYLPDQEIVFSYRT